MFGRVVHRVGVALVVAGYLTLSFVGYTLWGTSLSEQRAQAQLETSFSEQLAETAPPSVVDTSVGSDGAMTPIDTAADSREVAFFTPTSARAVAGEALARLWIPSINVERLAVHGTSYRNLQGGPGHFLKSALPGHVGNTAFAGHRTTYGAPFERLDELQRGDSIWVRTVEGQFRYEVTEQYVVDPSDVWVVKATDDAVLTLVTCHPRWSNSSRLVVRGKLVGESVETFKEREAASSSAALVASSEPSGPTLTAPLPMDPFESSSGASSGASSSLPAGLAPVTPVGALATTALGSTTTPQAAVPTTTPQAAMSDGPVTTVASSASVADDTEAEWGSWSKDSGEWLVVAGWSLLMLLGAVAARVFWRRGHGWRVLAVGCAVAGLSAQWMWCATLTGVVPSSL